MVISIGVKMADYIERMALLLFGVMVLKNGVKMEPKFSRILEAHPVTPPKLHR